MGALKVTSVAVLTALLAACGGSGSSTAFDPGSPATTSPQLPTTPAFSVTSVVEPAASTGAASLKVPFPPSPGYAGQAVFGLASVPANLRMPVTYANYAPSGITELSTLRQASSARPTVLDASSTVVVYACFAANSVLHIDGAPQFSFTLPPAFANRSVAYDLAIEQGGKWTTGYGGPATIVATATSATVDATGRFGFTIPASGSVCVALYGRPANASTPVPATPEPSAAPTATPTATATPHGSPTATPTATATPHGTPPATPMPTATPTASPTLSFSPSSVNVLGLGSSFALITLVHESDVTDAVGVSAPSCSGIATVTSTTGNGPSFTVTGLAAGTCTATAFNTGGLTATLHVSVTTSSIGVNAVGRKP